MTMDIKNDSQYLFIIDTDSYAGNFERELCAYITGVLGECGVGDQEQIEFNKSVSDALAEQFCEIVEHVADDHGCFRPCAISETPDRGNNGYGSHGPKSLAFPYAAYESVEIYFNQMPTVEMIQLMKERAQEYCSQEDIKIIGFRFLNKKSVVTTMFEETLIPI